MISALDGLVEELRRTGLPISVSEKMDGAAVLAAVDLGDRAAVRCGLAAALVKNGEHLSAFDTVFDLYFSGRPLRTDGGGSGDGSATEDGADGRPALADSGPGSGGDGPHRAGGSGGGLDELDDAAIRELVIDSLDAGEQGSLLQRSLARVLVTRHAGIQPGRAVAGTYYLFRTMRALGRDRVLTRLVERAEQRLAGPADELTVRLLVDDADRRITAFQQEIEAEIRRRLVADRGAEAVARTLRRPLPEDIDFLVASGDQVRALQDVLQPLARKLAAGMGERRRHHRRGAVDFRRTIRSSLSSGGVPLDVYFHKPRPAKPELTVLADISGSVSAFAAFTLQLTYALRSQFARVSTFVFVDGLNDVTDLVARSRNILEVTGEINRLGLGVWLDGHSDYGNALDTFWQRYGRELRKRTTVLVLGDARSNYHAPRAEILGQIAQRAGHVYWLNPEPRATWDSGDSVIGTYAGFCDGVVECRNLRQLRSFVERLG